MFDVIVIGSGLTGAVIAERIATVLNKKVLIIEKREHIAGNCYDYKDETGILVHKYGPHIFHTDNKKVFDYLSSFTNWDIYHHNVLAFIDGKKVPIPFNLNSIDILFPKELAENLTKKLLNKFSYGEKVLILNLLVENDSDLKFLAKYVYDNIFLNYTVKQWGLKPEEIDPEVTGRVPIFIGRDNRYFNDRYQCLPRQGYTKMFEKILANQNIKLLMKANFKEIMNLDFINKKIFFMGNQFKGKLVYTGKIDELFDFKFGELPYRSLNMCFEKHEVEFFQETTSVNYPNNYDFTRITEFKHLHPIKTQKTVILKEFPQKHIHNINEPYYPFFTKDAKQKYEMYLKFSKKFKNLVLAGRLADYKYYDMDDAVENALKVFERIFLKNEN